MYKRQANLSKRLHCSSMSYHGRDFAISLKELDNFALVSRFHPSKQTSIADSSRLVTGTKVVEFTTRESLAFGRLGFRKDADTPANSLSRCLENEKKYYCHSN